MEQPEALRLADALLEGDANFYAESSLWFDEKLCDNVSDAADELRRLHAENERLRAAALMLRDLVQRAQTPVCSAELDGSYLEPICFKLAEALALTRYLKEQQ